MSLSRETPMDLEDDPRGWSIDRVVHEICYSPSPQWLPQTQPQSQYSQNRQRLEATLRENDIDGDSLLSLDMKILKEDLGIASFGIRNIVMRAVKFYQGSSDSYRRMMFTTDSLNRMQASNTFLSPQITQSRVSVVPQSPAYTGLGIHPSVESRHTRSPSLNGGFGTQLFTPSHAQTVAEAPIHSVKPTKETTVASRSHIPQQPLLQNEHAQTKTKRHSPLERRDLQDAVSSTKLDPGQTKTELVKNNYNMVNGKKRIAPTFVEHLAEVKPVVEGQILNETYLSAAALPAQDVFYYNVATDVAGEDFYRVAVDEDEAFNISKDLPPGQRRAIGKTMKSFLRQGSASIEYRGVHVMVPYHAPRSDTHFKTPHSEQYFTLFRPGDERPKVQRLKDYPELKSLQSSKSLKPQQSFTGSSTNYQDTPMETSTASDIGEAVLIPDFDYLLAKYPVEESDEVLPVYGESDDENGYDEETWQEMEEEKAAAEASRNQPISLSPVQVEGVIKEAIEEFKHEWRESKLVAVQRKAYRHWMKAAREKTRQPLIKHFNGFRDHCSSRMQKLSHEVASNIWRNAAELKKQCQVLEVTVHQHEEYDYYSQVLLGDTPPERPALDTVAKPRAHKQHDLEDGEEIIESEPEATTDEDAFIDDTSSDAGSIHHDPDAEDWNPESWRPILPPGSTMVDHAGKSESSLAAMDHVPAQDIPMHDVNANDADVDSEDDEIVSSARKKIKHIKNEPNPQTLVKKRNPPPTLITLPKLDSSDNSDLDRTPRLPKSKYRNQGRHITIPVDLTIDSSPSGPDRNTNISSSDFSVHTPKLNPTQGKKAKVRAEIWTPDAEFSSSQDDTNLPSWDDVQGIRDTEWSFIETADSRRVLAKVVYGLDMQVARQLASFVNTLSTFERKEHCVVEGISVFQHEDFFVEHVSPKHQQSAKLLVLLYLTHCLGENTLEDFKVAPVHLTRAYEDKDAALKPFCETLGNILQALFRPDLHLKGKKRKRDQAPLSEVKLLTETEPEDTDDITLLDQNVQPSSHKKRKRKVEESQQANSQQQDDRHRIQEQEKRREEMAKRIAPLQSDGTARVIVNTEEPLVQLASHIASRIKPHQITGVQFMWREIVEDPKSQGCILAHTMGLGKTMQVTSLLVTLAMCNQSEEPKMRSLIPQHLQDGKTLILCPASLLNNWEDELLMWTPKSVSLKEIHKCDSIKKEDNVRMIRKWSRHGGVLIMSYERFRNSIVSSIKDKKDGEKVATDLEAILLDEASLVIADEAHMLKKASSAISKICKRIHTNSRIALTGSPLSNHLEEYHTMVDWIAPSYLGDIVQFRAKYSEPIQAGLYADSTVVERRTSLRKLHVLKRDLDPKISRADISAIAKDMPDKTEYFITIPLTDMQKEAYNVYVRSMLQVVGPNGRGNNATLWHWIAMLGWLCQHPSGFVKKLKDREAKAANEKLRVQDVQASDPADSSDGSTPVPEDVQTPSELADDCDVDTVGPLALAMHKALEILPDIDEPEALNDPALSHRTFAVKRIVEKAMEAGDKTLIFSHSIPTLNYLAAMLSGMRCPFRKITGETKVSDRQEYTKRFNNKDKYMVLLISMRAGGLGLNLQGANRVIIFDFGFNPTWEQQAIGRSYRLNQKKAVYVYRFRAGGTFEDRLFNTSVFKTQLFGRVVDKKNPKRHASKMQHADYLFPVKDVLQEDFDDCIGNDPKVLDAIIHELDFVRSIVMTETFQKEDDEQLTTEERKAAEEEYEDQRLRRDDPAAWYHKQEERRRAEQQRATIEAQKARQALGGLSRPSMLPIHTNNHQFRSFPTDAPRSTQYGLTDLPFGKEDIHMLGLPRDSQRQPDTQTRTMPGSYDDTYADATTKSWPS